MGKSVTPSCERHRGYRTRDRPPARLARRNGCCADAQARTANLLPLAMSHPTRRCIAFRRIAKIVDARGWEIRHHCIAKIRVTMHRRPPGNVRGGGAADAVRHRVVSGHALPQSSSAGRNLITLFSRVNNLLQSFFSTRRGRWRRARADLRPTHRKQRATSHQPHRRRALRASSNAGSSPTLIFFESASRRVDATSIA